MQLIAQYREEKVCVGGEVGIVPWIQISIKSILLFKGHGW